jgi:uncharacterized protein (TIGR00661 family)
MNIIYGVSGEGLGHVFEARQITARLRSEGHAVKILTYGDRAFESLRDFGPTRIEGIHLIFDDKGMSLTKTVRRNLGCIPFYLKNWGKLRRELEAFRPDVFVTAYEPFTTVAAHVLRRPLISMDNQNELLYIKAPRGTSTFALELVRLATRICTYGAVDYVIKTYDKPRVAKAGVHFVSPMIQTEIRRLAPTNGDAVLVYLTKPNPGLIEILGTIEERFIVYSSNRVGQEGNITFRPKGPTFLDDLAACKAIIGTTGFSLIADAIFLKKPYFGVPLRGQFEQTYNAQFLAGAGLGAYSEHVTRAQLEHFLSNLPRYREKLKEHDLDPAEQEETVLKILGKLTTGRSALSPVL